MAALGLLLLILFFVALFPVGVTWAGLWNLLKALERVPRWPLRLAGFLILLIGSAGIMVLLAYLGGRGGVLLTFPSVAVAAFTAAIHGALSRRTFPGHRATLFRLICLLGIPLLLAGVFYLSLHLGSWRERQLEELSRTQANTVVSALESYHSLHGEYPQDLAELVPDFLPALPGNPWWLIQAIVGPREYWLDYAAYPTNDQYSLYYGSYSYDSVTDEWQFFDW